MDDLENNRIRAVLGSNRPAPEVTQRIIQGNQAIEAGNQAARANVVNNARPVAPDLQGRVTAANTANQIESLSRANATTPATQQQVGKIGQFFANADKAIQPLNKPLITQQGVTNAVQTSKNALGSVSGAASKFLTSNTGNNVLRGASVVGGGLQAVNAGNELLNGNGNLLEKANSAINLGLGASTAVNPIAGIPNLGFQAGKAGGGLIANLADKVGLLDSFKPKQQAQTAGFADAERKFLASKTPTATTAPSVTQPATEKPFGFENLSAKDQAAILKDAQNSRLTSANLQLQGADGKINNSVLALPKAEQTKSAQPKAPRNIIQAAFAPKAEQLPQEAVQQAVNAGQAVQAQPQTLENPLLSLSDEELANTPTLEGADSNGRFFLYPNGKRINVPANRKPEDVVVGLDNFNKYNEFLASQSQGQANTSQFTSDGRQIANPVRVITPSQDFIEGFDPNGNPINGLPSQQVVKRDASGNAVLDKQGQPTLISDFLQQSQLTDAEKVQALKNIADVQTANISAQGGITQQSIQSGATNAAKNQEAGLIAEYFNPNTKPERRALLAPLVTGNSTQARKGFKEVILKDNASNETIQVLDQDTGRIVNPNQSTQAAAPKPSLGEFLDKARIQNPDKSEAELVSYYNQNYGG